MKKVLLLMMAAFFAVTAASAQEIGGWAVGPRLGIYTNTDTVIGVGAMARYRFDDHWRIEPSAVALLHKHCSVDISCDAHYIFDMGVVRLYPAAGVTANDIGKWDFGMNVGGGIDFNVADIFEMTCGPKWSPMFSDVRSNPVTLSVGAMFKF